MNSDQRPVAVVTGSNKGIGLAIVRGLCQKFKGDVILTGIININVGYKLIRELENKGGKRRYLNAEGLHATFHQLDIIDKDSISQFKAYLSQEYGGLDILINNAGVQGKEKFWVADTTPEKVEVVVRTNFTGTLDVCEALFPLLRPHARVVNVSSLGSFFGLSICSEAMRNTFTDKTLSMEELKQTMDKFVKSVWDGTYIEKGFAEDGYMMSKVGVTVMTFIQQRDIDTDLYPDVLINSCCPGLVRTDMTAHTGGKSPEQGAETPVYLALLPKNTQSPKGDFVSEKKIESWNSSKWSLYKMITRQFYYMLWYYICYFLRRFF